MKKLRQLLDDLEPKFAKNKFVHTLFDAADTLLFQPRFITRSGVHIRDGVDLKRTMFHVIIALQLCLLHGVMNIGHQHYIALGMFPEITDGLLQKAIYGLCQILPIVLVVHVVGLGIEILFAAKKGHSVEEGFLVTGVLIPLIMPPDIPLWMVAVATAFAVLVGKEAFGGTGMNILNVALMARVFVFFAYPGAISGDEVWVAYDYSWVHSLANAVLPGEDFLMIGAGIEPVHSFSGATPLALAAKGGWAEVEAATLPNGEQQYSISNLIIGFMPGSIGEMSKVGILAGIGILVATGIGSWRVMLSMLLGCAVMGLTFNVFAGDSPETSFLGVPFYYHFIMGGFLFAMAFMATDPVTAAQTNTGKFVYGFLIGAIGLIIRVSNPAYPEGWMMAILLMNVMAPLIDHYVIQGHIKRRLSRA